MSSHLNSEVTEAITQAQAKLKADAAAIALGTLYQDTAHALALAANSAVNNQQQNYLVQQAATNQGVMQIYSTDTAHAAVPVDFKSAAELPGLVAALPEALAQIAHAGKVQGTTDVDIVHPWTHAAREMMETVALALREFQQVAAEAGMTTVKQAAIAMVLKHMIEAPEQLEQYRKMLELIRSL